MSTSTWMVREWVGGGIKEVSCICVKRFHQCTNLQTAGRTIGMLMVR